MRQVFSFGKFYGSTRKQLKTPAFAFTEVEDFDDSRIPVHTHETAHFLFVVGGEYEAVVKEKKRLLPASTMIYYPAGTTHADHFSSRGGKFLTVSLTSDINQKLLKEIKFFEHAVDFSNHEICWMGKRIRKELQSPDSLSPIVLEAMANEMMVYASRSLDKSDKPPAWLKQAHEMIRDCCESSTGIAEIAAAVGVHPLHLARTFRRFFGCSPAEYLRKCRIEMASNLLLNGKKSLVEIALICGFADQSQFTRSFKQHTGITPAKYREFHNS